MQISLQPRDRPPDDVVKAGASISVISAARFAHQHSTKSNFHSQIALAADRGALMMKIYHASGFALAGKYILREIRIRVPSLSSLFWQVFCMLNVPLILAGLVPAAMVIPGGVMPIDLALGVALPVHSHIGLNFVSIQSAAFLSLSVADVVFPSTRRSSRTTFPKLWHLRRALDCSESRV